MTLVAISSEIMEDTINLEVTTNVNQFPFEKKFPSTIQLREFKASDFKNANVGKHSKDCNG